MAKKKKFIDDEWTRQYKQQFDDLSNQINPKPSKEEREREIKRLREERGM